VTVRKPAKSSVLAAALVAAAVSTWTPDVSADPLPTNDYQIDLFQGPLLLPLRVVSLGGAYAGFAEDIPGIVSNAAAPAVRKQHAFRHVEVDLSGSLSVPIDWFENNDFDDSGDIDQDYSNFVYATGGLMVQVGPFGLGLLADAQTYSLTDSTGQKTAIVLARQIALGAASFVNGQLAVGAGARGVILALDPLGADFLYAGAAPELGVLVRPNGIPFRFGATFRLPVFAAPTQKKLSLDNGLRQVLTLPERVVEPWELETGVAVQVGPRPLNQPFVDPEDEDDAAEKRVREARARRATERASRLAIEPDPGRRIEIAEELDRREADLVAQEDAFLERETERILGRHDDAIAALPRQRLLLLMSLVVSGAVGRGVSVAQFLGQNDPSASRGIVGGTGAEVNFSPRFGVEVEPVESWLILRAGTYYEPNRFGNVGREHFTGGAQLKVFSTDLFGLLPELAYGVEVGLDLAPRYQSLSASIAVFR